MSKKGGQTTFSGTKYQAEITALYLGRLLDPRHRGNDEMVVEVRPECDVEADVDDILVRFKDGHTEWFQVKENIDSSGETWQKMWVHFENQLSGIQHPGDRIVLILGNPQRWSKDIREVCVRAESTKDSQEWLKVGHLSRDQFRLVDSLVNILGKARQEELYDLMRRIDVRVIEADRVRVDHGPNWMPVSNYNPLDLYDKILRIVFDAAERGKSIERDWLLEILTNEQVQINFADSPAKIESTKESFQILFDESHGQRVWYPVKPTIDDQFHVLSKLAGEKFSVGYLPNEKQLIDEDMSHCKLFILTIGPRGMTELSRKEISLLHEYVRKPGHCLLVISTYDGDAHHKANFNDLLYSQYGIKFNYDVIMPEDSAKDDAYVQAGHYEVDSRLGFDAFPINEDLSQRATGLKDIFLKDIKKIRALSCCSIYITPQRNILPLLASSPTCKIFEQESPSWGSRSNYKDDYQREAILMAASKNGRVIALGGWKMFTDNFINDQRYDNKQLFVNILDWIASQ